MYLSFNLEQFT